MSEPIHGRRIYPDESGCIVSTMQAGDYGRSTDGKWLAHAPVELGGPVWLNRPGHEWKIEEHEDGTISVTPSIRILDGDGKPDIWHGYLTRGVWRAC